MVSIRQIRASIAQLTKETSPRIAVFFGGTSGIGQQTLNQLVRLKFPIRVYVIGRESTRAAMQPFLDNLHTINTKSDLIWVEAEASLLSEVTRVCKFIKTKEEKVDLLFLSAGYAPFAGRSDTPEGLDVTHALGYYARMLFVQHLLPLLRSSSQPHVISVLSGSILSRSFTVDDLHLEKPGAWGGLTSQLQMGTMNTLTLDRHAAKPKNAGITFLHSYPGWVNTGNSKRYQKQSIWPSISWPLLLAPFGFPILSVAESGERHLYMATDVPFGAKRNNTRGDSKMGLSLLNEKCDVEYDEAILEELRAGAQEKVWTKTMEILQPYL